MYLNSLRSVVALAAYNYTHLGRNITWLRSLQPPRGLTKPLSVHHRMWSYPGSEHAMHPRNSEVFPTRQDSCRAPRALTEGWTSLGVATATRCHGAALEKDADVCRAKPLSQHTAKLYGFKFYTPKKYEKMDPKLMKNHENDPQTPSVSPSERFAECSRWFSGTLET